MNKSEAKSKLAIKISLASADVIRGWSYGEVKKPETINYKSLLPERDGLFDQRIFGPIKSYECACGKYKKIRSRGRVCERCQVETTEATVRRSRMGHIELEEPIAHFWFMKTAPSRLALLLEMKAKDLEEVVYFVSYVVLDPGTISYLKPKMVFDLGNSKTSEKTRSTIGKILQEIAGSLDQNSTDWDIAMELITDLKNTNVPFSMDEFRMFIEKHTGAKIGIGAVAIESLLKQVNLKTEIERTRSMLASNLNLHQRVKLIARLELLNGLEKSESDPAWMVMRVVPVIPPDLRPIIRLDGGRFTASEINDLYRRIIIRNNRLAKLRNSNAPELIINDGKRMLQESVDALFDNERKSRPVTGKDRHPLKSLTSLLKGKQGRFRQNLLGKRVDYSGRSVIAVGPELKMYQCGLPWEMALTLFKPFVIRELVKQGLASNIKAADRLIVAKNNAIWSVLEEVVKERPVMLNRAPTLHRLGIQGFEVVLVVGKAIRLHPLVTSAFNADFDGDQMAVHVPISDLAVAEVRGLMLASNSILGPKDGQPIVGPTQDMVLGLYYLTSERRGAQGEGMIFYSIDEVITAYETDRLSIHALIFVPAAVLKNKKIEREYAPNDLFLTSPGRLIFNQIFAEPFPFILTADSTHKQSDEELIFVRPDADLKAAIKNYRIQPPLKKKDFKQIIITYFNSYGSFATAEMMDQMKTIGFKFSDQSGATVAIGDIKTYSAKSKIIKDADEKVKQILDFQDQGMLTKQEKTTLICQLWDKVKNQMQKEVVAELQNHPDNPIFMMADSGARGNASNFTQLIGMRGLMSNPKGDTIEIPIKSSFREGLSILEYFISTHGARKGFADVALKTADAGYLTRRLVDVAQETIITEIDCKTRHGFLIEDIIETSHNSLIVSFHDRLIGRYTFQEFALKNGETIPKDTLITKQIAEQIINNGYEKGLIRSILTCRAAHGVCEHCYGINLATGRKAQIGDVVGVMAAQSIGEPGTQLTMQTFHTGGVAGESDITRGLPRVKELFDVTEPKGTVATISEISGTIKSIDMIKGFYHFRIESQFEAIEQISQYNAVLRVKVGDKVRAGQKLTEGAVNLRELLKIADQIKDLQNYILKEIQKVYRMQGIEIADKNIEVIIQQMLKRVQVIDSGDTNLLPGELLTLNAYREVTNTAISTGKRPPVARQVILGIKKVPLKSDSFLSAASFQDTKRVLVSAILAGRVDELNGLKENLMIGNIIPAGTGLLEYDEIMKMGVNATAHEY